MLQFVAKWRKRHFDALRQELKALDKQIEEVRAENRNLLYVERRIVDNVPPVDRRDERFGERMAARVAMRKGNNDLLGRLLGHKSQIEQKLSRAS